MIGWTFPLNNDGKEDGLNDPGIETFRDDPLRALAREINQNSSDAADDSQKPVEVHFELLEISTQKFPELNAFRKTLNACERYWKHNAGARKFFTRARVVVSQPKMSILKISDFNTTGLVGADGDHNSDWFKLTKSVGASDKEGGAGGSFGIGKHAPFACSDIRTVFYGTKDKTGKVAFQGVARLVTHESRNKTTQGTGYYGAKSKNGPVTKQGDIPSLFRRKQTGTDIFVAGFHHQHRDWADEIIKSVLNNFFVAIHEGRLIVKVGTATLNQNSVGAHIRRCNESDPDFRAAPYYESLTSEEVRLFSVDDFEGLGRVELRILIGKDYPKRIAMVRSTGMKIYDKGSFQTPVRFAGVLIAKGQKLNEELRAMEPPSHNDWQAERHENPEYAKSLRRKLYGWMNDCVRSLAVTSDTETLDAEGLSQYLPDDSDDIPGSADEDAAEGERTDPLPEVEVQIRSLEHRGRRSPEHGLPSMDTEFDESETTEVSDDTPGTEKGAGGVADGGRGQNEHAGRSLDPQGTDTAAGSRQVALRNLRVYCSDSASGRYRILFEPDATGPGHLQVYVVGEVGEEPAPIDEAYISGGAATPHNARRGQIGPLDFKKGKRTTIDITLRDSLHCALGVSAYAD